MPDEPNPAAVVGELARRVLAALGPSALAGTLEISAVGAIAVRGRIYRLAADGIVVVQADEGEDRIGVLDESTGRVDWREPEPRHAAQWN